jgi:hypothetical protein
MSRVDGKTPAATGRAETSLRDDRCLTRAAGARRKEVMTKHSLKVACDTGNVGTLTVAALAGLALMAISPAGCGVLDDKPKSVGDFCVEYAKRECEPTAVTCSRMPAECEPIRRAACQAFVAPLMNAPGRLYRPDNGEACLEQLEATYKKTVITAGDLAALKDKCVRVVEGSVAANGTCTVDQDCQSPLVCDRTRCGPVRVVAAGANCANPGERCQPAEYCKAADGLSVCSASADKNAACSAMVPCKPAFRCNTTCVDKAAVNAACTTDDDCTTGYCNPYAPSGVGRTCLPGLIFAPFAPSCEGYFGPSSPPADGGA